MQDWCLVEVGMVVASRWVRLIMWWIVLSIIAVFYCLQPEGDFDVR